MRNFFADFGLFQPSFGIGDFKCILATVLWKLGWLVTLNNNSNNRSSCSSENNKNTMTWSTTPFIEFQGHITKRCYSLHLFSTVHTECVPQNVIIICVASDSLSFAFCVVLSCRLNYIAVGKTLFDECLTVHRRWHEDSKTNSMLHNGLLDTCESLNMFRALLCPLPGACDYTDGPSAWHLTVVVAGCWSGAWL